MIYAGVIIGLMLLEKLAYQLLCLLAEFPQRWNKQEYLCKEYSVSKACRE